jgi:hypothetical protein
MKARMKDGERMFKNNCPINECTGDGRFVGRCWFNLKNNYCPRHGNVEHAIKHYIQTGELTPEKI